MYDLLLAVLIATPAPTAPPSEVPNTVQALTAWLIGTGTGVVALVTAIFKIKADHRKGIREDNRSDDDSLNAKALALVQTQFDFFIRPLKEEVAGLQEEVTSLRDEVKTIKSRYQKAIDYISKMRRVVLNSSPELEAELPPLPKELEDDLS